MPSTSPNCKETKYAWPLWSQITLALLLVTAIVTYVSGEIIQLTETQRLIRQAHTQLDRTFSAVSATVIDAVITEDVSVLETTVEQLTRIDANITDLQINNEDGLTLVHWKSNVNLNAKSILHFEKNITFAGEKFGIFHVIWNAKYVYDDISKQVDNVRLVAMTAMLTLSLVFALGIHLLVIRPIRILDERLLCHSPGKINRIRHVWVAKEFQHVNNTIDQLKSLTSSKKELENEVELRIQTENQLILARDEALGANAAKSQFLANMSHELRTPLNAIIGYSEMMKDDFQNEMANQYDIYVEDLVRIETSGKYLLTLINDILDLSKVEAHKMDLFLEQFSLRTLVREVVEMAQPLILKNTNSLSVNIKNDVDLMLADETKVRQILFNLISNACKFTTQGKITFSIQKILRLAIDGVSLSIKDEGLGISEENLKKLFQPFTQVDTSNTRAYGGTGLGLILSKQLCQSMAGDISVESQYARGSTFTVWLPLNVEAALSQQQLKLHSDTLQDPKQKVAIG